MTSTTARAAEISEDPTTDTAGTVFVKVNEASGS